MLSAPQMCSPALTPWRSWIGAYAEKVNRYLDPELRRAVAAEVRPNARLFEVQDDHTLAVQPECRDAKDNKFLSLASVARVEVIVSSDEYLLVMLLIVSSARLSQNLMKYDRMTVSESVPRCGAVRAALNCRPAREQ